MTNMEVIFLGTSAGVPTKNRNVSSILIRYGSELIFVDTGEGTQRQAYTFGIGLRKNIKIIITHMHGDHVLGLIPILQTLTLLGRRDPLEIYAPYGIKQFIKCNTMYLNIKLPFKLKIRYLANKRIFDCGPYVIESLKNKHLKYSYSIAIIEKPRKGKFNPNKALKDGVPKKYWKLLKAGIDVEVNGRIYYSKDYVSPPFRGRKIVISGDTRPFKALISFAKEADVLIHEATFSSRDVDKSIQTYHSTAKEANSNSPHT